MGDTPTADEARAATLEREKLSALAFLGVIPFHANDSGVGFVGGSDVDQERYEPWGKDDDDQDAPPSGEAGPSAPKRSTKKATKASGGSSTKKATKATGGSSTKKVDKAAAPEEPPKDSAEGERYTQADCALLIRLVNDADAAMARILNRTEKIDKVWTFVRENFNEQCEGSARSRQSLRDKYDNMLRAARKHRLALARVDGTHGGSGNGRDTVDRLTARAPQFFDELLQSGALEGPLGEDEWGGNDPAETNEPIAGRLESRKLAAKIKRRVPQAEAADSDEAGEEPEKKRGRPKKVNEMKEIAHQQMKSMKESSIHAAEGLL
eukprot:jgi/Tetstr1/431358/TSEL_021049.t1